MIKVLVAERNQMMRYGIQSALESMPGCRIIAEASSIQQLLWCLTSLGYDILLVEAYFLEELGQRLFDEFSIGVAPPRMIVYGRQDPTQGVIALQNGACGYLMSRCSPSELREAIARVAMGKRYIDATLAEELANFLWVSPHALPRLLLSPDELRVYKMLALGLTPAAIAAQVDMSVPAVDHCKARILEKLERDGIAERIHATMRHGLAATTGKSTRPALPAGESSRFAAQHDAHPR